MAANHHLLDADVGDGILDDRGGADVVGVDAVGDVAVHKDVAGPAVAHGGLGHAAVGAAYPQDLGPLALCELGKGVRVILRRLLGVGAVAGENAIERICGKIR